MYEWKKQELERGHVAYLKPRAERLCTTHHARLHWPDPTPFSTRSIKSWFIVNRIKEIVVDVVVMQFRRRYREWLRRLKDLWFPQQVRKGMIYSSIILRTPFIIASLLLGAPPSIFTPAWAPVLEGLTMKLLKSINLFWDSHYASYLQFSCPLALPL